MTPAELRAWQDRNFGAEYGAQVKAAQALATRVPTYRSWLAGRRPMPPVAVRLAEYIDRLDAIPQCDTKKQSKGEERNDD